MYGTPGTGAGVYVPFRGRQVCHRFRVPRWGRMGGPHGIEIGNMLYGQGFGTLIHEVCVANMLERRHRCGGAAAAMHEMQHSGAAASMCLVLPTRAATVVVVIRRCHSNAMPARPFKLHNRCGILGVLAA